jgi:hypothetical protein
MMVAHTREALDDFGVVIEGERLAKVTDANANSKVARKRRHGRKKTPQERSMS